MEGAKRSSEILPSKCAPRLLSACQDQNFLFTLWNLLSCLLSGKWDLHCAREAVVVVVSPLVTFNYLL